MKPNESETASEGASSPASGCYVALRAEKARCLRHERHCKKAKLTAAMQAWRFRASGVAFAIELLRPHNAPVSDGANNQNA